MEMGGKVRTKQGWCNWAWRERARNEIL